MNNNEDNYESKEEGNGGGKILKEDQLVDEGRNDFNRWPSLLPLIFDAPAKITVSLIPIIQLDAPLPPTPPPSLEDPRRVAIHLCANLFTNHVRKLRRIPVAASSPRRLPSSIVAQRPEKRSTSTPIVLFFHYEEKRSIIPLRFLHPAYIYKYIYYSIP